jgi:hypothetical protein
MIKKGVSRNLYIFHKNNVFIFSEFPPKILLKLHRYKLRMGKGTDKNIFLVLQQVFKDFSKSFINRSLIDH